MEAWKLCDLILTSRLKVRDRAQKLLFERHEKYFPDTSVPLLYRPEDTRRQNIMVTIPGPSPEGRPNQQELVLNDVVEVPLKYAREVLGSKRGYASQGITIDDPQKVWIIDDYLQWSNLAYLAVSLVEHLSQLDGWYAPPPPRRRVPVRHAASLPRSRRSSSAKSTRGSWWYKRQDAAKGLRFNLKVDHILGLKEAQSNRCTACNIELLWAYQPTAQC